MYFIHHLQHFFHFKIISVISGPDTSKEHCFIENTTGNVVLNPLSSLCTINGNKIKKPSKLYQGKKILHVIHLCAQILKQTPGKLQSYS